jgi:hypothetical protein
MYLGFDLLARIFPHSSGIKESELHFHTVSDQGANSQPRGLFIPLWGNSQDLLEAIHNGAVAAIWEQGKPIPAYRPNHFPLFFTNNLAGDVIRLMKEYIQILKQEDERETMSNFLFIDEQLLNEKLKTYDSAELYSEMLPLAQTLMDLRRG